MRTLVVTGFRPFGNYPVNSSQVVAERLDKIIFVGFRVYANIFDATIPKENRGEELLDFAQRVHASGIICLGMASDKTGLCLEEVAKNRISNEKYCLELGDVPIDRERPFKERLYVDLEPWNIAMFLQGCRSVGMSVMAVSRDAGGFCCNHLMFQFQVVQLALEGFRRIPFIFIHVPCILEAVPDQVQFAEAGKVTMTADYIIRALTILLKHAKLSNISIFSATTRR